MRDVRSWLKEGDPLTIDPALAPDDVRAIRRAVVAEVGARRQVSGWWPGPVATATMLAAAIIAGINIGRMLPARPIAGAGVRTAADERPPEIERRRQVQFTTPGGTHIVWVFDSDFEL
jgi:hypothetical protein